MSPRVWGCWKSLWSPVFLCNHPSPTSWWFEALESSGLETLWKTMWKLSKQVLDQWLKTWLFVVFQESRLWTLQVRHVPEKRPPATIHIYIYIHASTKMIHFLSALKTSSWSCAPKKLCQLWAFPEVAVSGLMKIAGMLLAARLGAVFGGGASVMCDEIRVSCAS